MNRIGRRLGWRLPLWVQNGVVIAIVLTVVGMCFGAMDFLHGDSIRDGAAGFLNKILSAWVWALLVPVVLAIDRRLPLSKKQFPRRLLVHFLFSAPVATAHTGLLALVELPFKIISWNPLLAPQYAYYYFSADWFAYFAIFAVIFAVRYYKWFVSGQLEMERLQNRLLQIHLDNLRMQLEPHFLSNALNAISSEVEENPPLARQIIADLGVLLRLSHEYKDRQLIPLMEEISILEHYLAIQRVRFGGRIKIEMHIAPDVKYVRVPCLLFQPLVENAIRHGRIGSRSGGTITISVDRMGDRVEIRLSDDGVGLPPGWQLETSSGQGLTITQKRLAALYPDGATSFAVGAKPGGGTEVRVTLAAHQGSADDD